MLQEISVPNADVSRHQHPSESTIYIRLDSGSLVHSYSKTGGGGEAALPYKSDGGVRRKILRTPLKGTRILFYGCVPYLFPPLRGTNSTTTKYIIGTANFDSNKDIFRTLSSQGRFGNLYWDNSGSSHFRF